MGPIADVKGSHYSHVATTCNYAADVENPLADIDRIKTIADPAERAREIGKVLNAVPVVYAELRQLRQAAVLELREQGLTYSQMAPLLGLHRNRIQQIAEGRTGGGKGGGGLDQPVE